MKIRVFQAQALATAASIYVLIVLGGIVTSTGSGLACPDWPLCHGHIIPPLNFNILVEFVHRLWTIVVTVLVTATAILAWKRYRWRHKITGFALLTFILLLSQVLLGMLTVQSGTEPMIVTAHLALATLVFATSLIGAVFSLTQAQGVE